ncbi:hypothetical protein [Syntrophaceticus schinkii]
MLSIQDPELREKFRRYNRNDG